MAGKGQGYSNLFGFWIHVIKIIYLYFSKFKLEGIAIAKQFEFNTTALSFYKFI